MGTSASSVERSLLFGAFAVQRGWIDDDALSSALNAWGAQKQRPLGDILRAQQKLTSPQLEELEKQVEAHLADHQHQTDKSLKAITLSAEVQEHLSQITDPDVQASLASAGQQPPTYDEYATEAPSQATEPTDVGEVRAEGLVQPASASRYRVLRPHAKGGLGEVFLAVDEELGREVALKEIQSRFADSPERRARFLLEAEVTGGLEHPGVVPVYGLGQYPDGRPYYAMRFIRGESLKEAIERFHREADLAEHFAKRSLQLRELLGRFVDVCNAIAYAHSRGVLHRDIKPGNVMLGKFGETLVVDWGLAKSIDDQEIVGTSNDERPLRPSGTTTVSVETLAGSVIGTPQYMSPEQAAGRLERLGPASDIYSLGATLYCLLTGKPPLIDGDVAAILKKVKRGALEPPRSRCRLVPAALDAICMKALALHPSERYPSATALAEDIEHWLADEPVPVHRDPWLERAARWVRRHRTGVFSIASGLIIGLVVLSGAVVFLTAANERERKARAEAVANFSEAERQRTEAETQRAEAVRQRKSADDNFLRAENARADAVKNLQEAERQRKIADANFQRAEQAFQTTRNAVDKYFTRVSEDTLLNQPGMQPLRRALLEEALAYYRQFLKERKDDGILRDQYADAWFREGRILEEIASPTEALPSYQESLRMRRLLVAESEKPVPDRLYALGNALNALGRVQQRLGKEDAALEYYREAAEVRRQLGKLAPDNAEYTRTLANTLMNIGLIHRERDEAEAARKLFEQAQTLRQEALEQDEKNLPLRRDLGKGHYNLGLLELETKNLPAAETHLTSALESLTIVVARDSNDLGSLYVMAACYRIQGDITSAAKKYEAARGMYERGRDILEKLAVRNPQVFEYRATLAGVYVNLARQELLQKKTEDAHKLFLRALALQKKLFAEHADSKQLVRDLAVTQRFLALILLAKKMKKEARAYLDQSLEHFEELNKKYPDDMDVKEQLEDTRELHKKYFDQRTDHSFLSPSQRTRT